MIAPTITDRIEVGVCVRTAWRHSHLAAFPTGYIVGERFARHRTIQNPTSKRNPKVSQADGRRRQQKSGAREEIPREKPGGGCHRGLPVGAGGRATAPRSDASAGGPLHTTRPAGARDNLLRLPV